MKAKLLIIAILFILTGASYSALFAQNLNNKQKNVGQIHLNKKGYPDYIENVKYNKKEKTVEETAKAFIKDNLDILMLNGNENIKHIKTSISLGGKHVCFVQYVDDVPILGTETVISFNKNEEITFVTNGFKSNINSNTKPSIDKVVATQTAENAISSVDLKLSKPSRSSLKVWIDDEDNAHLIWQTIILPNTGEDYICLVDAHSGECRSSD